MQRGATRYGACCDEPLAMVVDEVIATAPVGVGEVRVSFHTVLEYRTQDGGI